VFDVDFDLVALHHSGRDFTDEDRNRFDLKGDPVTQDTPEALRYWVANEGASESRRSLPILRSESCHLSNAPLSRPQFCNAKSVNSH
jgi:hypothetical protein